MTNRTSARRWLVAMATVSVLIAASCGSDDDAATATTAAPATSAANVSAPSGETRAVTHAFGTTEVPIDPQRIASVGYEEQQMILHFGKVPVLQREYFGEQPYATWPWDTPYLDSAQPEVFTEEMPFERIAAAQPDLIMATNAGLDEAMYQRLSEIAPTVAHNPDYPVWETPSEVMFMDVGRVFGMEDEAQQMVDETNDQLAAVAAAHPEWKDLYAGTLSIWDPIVNADNTQHARGQLLAALGFKEITEDVLPYQDDYPTVPFENVDLLDKLDVGIWIVGDPTPQVVLDLPLRDTLKLHTEGREIYTGPVRTASFGTLPHQVDFVLDWLVPELELALDGDPATPVPSAVDAGIAPAA